MSFTYLPNEILLHILQSCNSIADVLALGACCQHLHSILQASSNRLPTLFLAAEAEYGPLADAINLVTHNDSQPAHLPRPSPPLSFALLRQLISVGRTANSWADLYPFQKWRGPSSSLRRFLTDNERHLLRRAIYRTWLYSLAFHNQLYSRTARRSPPVIRQRALLLRSWPTSELAELLDFQSILRQMLSSIITPSNGTVIRRHKQRNPDDPFPLVSVTHPAKYAIMHGNAINATPQDRLAQCANTGVFHGSPTAEQLQPFAASAKYTRTHKELHGTTLEGWGDEISHYYVLEDMFKLHPGQILYLYSAIMEATQGSFHSGQSAKGLVESFVAGIEGAGSWFENNGETLGETVGFVVGERGGDAGEIRAMVEDGMAGIAIEEAE